MKTFILNLLFVCFFAFNSQSQNTIIGELLDETTKEPLIGATLVVKGSSEACVVDINGNFKLVTSQKFPLTLVVTFLGYNTKEINISEPTNSLKINLSANVVSLKALEIKDIRISEKQKQANSNDSLESLNIF
jgi:iron complex outermembrane receptor protein